MRKWWVFWPLYAALMGFALGASFFFGMYGRNVTESSLAAQHEQEPTNEPTKSKRDETDETIAFYTLWLMAFTGILAFATIGLGGATILLYATGEKQFKFAIRSSIRQSRDMHKSIATSRSLAESADLSAKAALRVEQPILTADSPELIGLLGPLPKDRVYSGQYLRTIPHENCTVREINFRNLGRTPAILDAMIVGRSIAKQKPPRPIYTHTTHFRDGAIIPPSDSFAVSIDFDFELNEFHRAELAGGAIIWFWCVLIYYDFMDLRLGREFGWQWNQYPEDMGRPNTYQFMALQNRGNIDPELLRIDYQSAAD